MLGRPDRSRRDLKDDDTAVRMCDFLDIDTESDGVEKAFRGTDRVSTRLRADHSARRLVRDTEDQMPSSFVGECHAVLTKTAAVDLSAGFLELEALILGR